jgi:thiaminase
MRFQIRCGVQLVLWLLGKPHTNHAIQHHVAESKRSNLKTAPISDLQRYRRFEDQEQKDLEASAYHPKILAWAKQYLGEEFETTVEKGKSIVVECVEKLNKDAWASRIEKFLRMESGH